MPYDEIAPEKALAKQQAGAVLVDVRSQAEVAEGLPAGALNIPLMELRGGGLVPNPDFVRVFEAVVPKGAEVLVSCKSGGRSAKACEALAARGYAKLTNVAFGFAGMPDPSGEIAQKGWKARGLPCDPKPAPGKSYAELAPKAGK